MVVLVWKMYITRSGLLTIVQTVSLCFPTSVFLTCLVLDLQPVKSKIKKQLCLDICMGCWIPLHVAALKQLSSKISATLGSSKILHT